MTKGSPPTCDRAAIVEQVAAVSGSYMLLLRLDRMQEMHVGRLGCNAFAAG
jgi:hypothetical protein